MYSDGSTDEVWMLLLSEALMFTTPCDSLPLSYKHHVPLKACWIRDLPDHSDLESGFEIITATQVVSLLLYRITILNSCCPQQPVFLGHKLGHIKWDWIRRIQMQIETTLKSEIDALGKNVFNINCSAYIFRLKWKDNRW